MKQILIAFADWFSRAGRGVLPLLERAPLAGGHARDLELKEDSGAFNVRLVAGSELDAATTQLVTTDVLGKPVVAQVPYENADGSPVTVDRDFFGKPRDRTRPTPGPFERPGSGGLRLRVH